MAGHERGATAHEGVKDCLIYRRMERNEVLHKPDWLFVRMSPIARRHHIEDVARGPSIICPKKPPTSAMGNHDHLVLPAVAPTKTGIFLVPNHRMKERQSLAVHPVRHPCKRRTRPAAAAAAAAAAVRGQNPRCLRKHSIHHTPHSVGIVIRNRFAFDISMVVQARIQIPVMVRMPIWRVCPNHVD